MYETCDQRNYPFQASPEAIPRSYYYPTSEGSEAGSPGGGGGGGSFGNRGPLRSSNQQTQSQELNYERSQEDTPFDPSTYAISPVQSPARRDFALPPEHSLPASLHSATPNFGGDAQQFIGQYPHFRGSHQQGQNQSLGVSYGLPHHGFVPLATSPPVGSRRLHQQPQRTETSASSSSPGSGNSSGFASPTVAPTALHHHGMGMPAYPDAGDYLRHQLGLPPGEPVNLNCLPDPPANRKPSQPLPVLIKLAIYGSPQKKLTLKGIYEAIENRFEFFKNDNKGAWKRSIRHNLSLNQVFRNTPRPITEPGKGSYWELDVTRGEGYKRERKRRNKKARRQTQSAPGQESESESISGDEEFGSDTSSIRRSESPSTRAGHFEPGSSHANLGRRGSPHAQNEVSSRLARGVYTEPGRTPAPTVWPAVPPGQSAQGQYHQPTPFRFFPPHVPMAFQEEVHPMLRAVQIPQAGAWHPQQQMRQLNRPASVPSYTTSMSAASSSMSGNQGQVHEPGPIPHPYAVAFQGSQSASRGGQFQGFGEQRVPEDNNTDSAFPPQGGQGDRKYYG